ncbi:MAG: anthranilate synthase component I [Parvularculales bacterium]
MLPDFDTFKEIWDTGKPQVLWVSCVADLETPVSAMLKLSSGQENCFLLESVEGGNIRDRYSIIGLTPDAIWRTHGNKAEINRNALHEADAFKPCDEDALTSLRSFLDDARLDLPDHLPPMAAGVFGYMAYDTVRLMEHLPVDKPDPLGVPDGLFLRPTIVAVFDSVTDSITIVTPVRAEADVMAQAAYVRAEERLSEIIDKLEQGHPPSIETPLPKNLPTPVSNISHDDYIAAVKQAKDYITQGDVFQVVLSQRFTTSFDLPPFYLYRALRRINPSPFLYFLNFGDFSVVGSSPEILVRVRNGKVTIRPLAGTRTRGNNRKEDKKIGAELLANPKERAEHLMLLDLGRNDTGRVSSIGSVKTTEQFSLEYTSHLIHIVSNVEGTLAPSYDAISALIAGFPAGTVSGAPKIRAMEIIDELEMEKRGIYAGCVGYFSASGDMDTCIALRTAVIKDNTMHVQAGGGIVADSNPEEEYQETVNKAKALFRAAEEAVRFASCARRGQ